MAANWQMSFSWFWRLARSRQAAGHMSAIRQTGEAALLYIFYGVSPSYYQVAAFWERNVSWRDKTNHLSTSEYRKKLALYNPPIYRKLSQNKLSEKAILSFLGIPTPEYLGYYRPGATKNTETTTLTNSDDLSRYIADNPDLDRICFKGIEGWAGQSFEIGEIIHSDNGPSLRRARTREALTVEQFCDDVLNQGQHTEGSIMERFLIQHEVLSALNASSLNTLRVWVLQTGNDKADVLLAHFRIGRAGAIVDNQGDRLIVPVDPKTGRLEAAIDGTPERRAFPTHPDHHATIEGVQLPFFDEAMRLAERTVLEFPGIRFAGVDVAIATDGPRIIELNVFPGRLAQAHTKVPVKLLIQ